MWTADITYIPTTEGWLYLAVVMDLYTRIIVGYAMDSRMTKELALNALRMAETEMALAETRLTNLLKAVGYAE